MNEEQKAQYKERYYQAKQKSPWKFWPDIIYKDLLVSFAIFLLLIGLAAFIGVANEPKADPNDYSYIPRPEWYFLFLFKFLAIYGQIPFLGRIEWLATALVPTIGVLALFLVPFLDRSPYRHFNKRGPALACMTILVATIVGLTLIADIPTTVQPNLQILSGILLPGAGMLLAFVIPLIIKKGTNPVLAWMTGLFSVLILGLSVAVISLAPLPEEVVEEEVVPTTLSEQVVAGQDLYSFYCAECHGAEGEGGEVKGVEGFEGVTLNALNGKDVMYTRTDDTLFNVINYGQLDLENAMPPFGLAYGGELQTWQMEAIVYFMRYTWDDRVELPAEAATSSIPELKEGEVPSYEVHIASISKRYCISCHRPGKKNNNYLMQTYDEVMNSGDHAPNIISGDAVNSTLMRMLHREEGLEAGDPMPPTKELKPEYVLIFEKWIAAGAPNTAAEAAALSSTAPAAGPAPETAPEAAPTPAP